MLFQSACVNQFAVFLKIVSLFLFVVCISNKRSYLTLYNHNNLTSILGHISILFFHLMIISGLSFICPLIMMVMVIKHIVILENSLFFCLDRIVFFSNLIVFIISSIQVKMETNTV